MRRFVRLLSAAALSCLSCSSPALPHQEPVPETITVPSLGGPDVVLPVSEAGRVTPLGWALILDFARGRPHEARVNALFAEQCRVRPGLQHEVRHWFTTKAKVDVARRAHPRIR